MKKTTAALLGALLMIPMIACGTSLSGSIKQVRKTAEASGMSAPAVDSLISGIEKAPERFFELLETAKAEMAADPWMLRRVDKTAALPSDFEPSDLVALDGSGLSLSRPGHRLREPASLAMVLMDKAARADGVTLVISSTYRSYAYQEALFSRNVAEMGEAQAERESARPGTSQHQLGTVVDFGSISDAFAETKAGKWMEANASRFGFSLSYPRGMESVTGYVWESWHFRYIGMNAVALQKEYFDDIQQNLMFFLHETARAPQSK